MLVGCGAPFPSPGRLRCILINPMLGMEAGTLIEIDIPRAVGGEIVLWNSATVGRVSLAARPCYCNYFKIAMPSLACQVVCAR